MPELDFFSITMAVAINFMAVAFALPWFIGQKISASARRSQQFLLLQGLAWVLILGASRTQSTFWSSALSLAAISVAMTALWRLGRALSGWLSPRSSALRHLLAAGCILTPLGFLGLIQSLPERAAWFSACYGICTVLVGCMALQPAKAAGKLWRHIVSGVGFVMGPVLLLRSYIALHPDWLQQFNAKEAMIHQTLIMAPAICSTLLLLAILLAWRDESQRQSLERHQEDDLTGLPHRHTLVRQAQGMLRRAQRGHLPLSVVLLDMDQFQRVNRRHGYDVGNEALQLLSLALQKQMRGDEVAARWDGESFCLLVHADAAGVQSLFTRLKSAIQLGLMHELQLSLDFSAGCVHVPEVWDSLNFDDLIHEALQALRQAKKNDQGGLKIITLQPPDHEGSPALPTQRSTR
jgi:diguanylate cyclase (GGDEF)-like protein